MLTQVDGIPMKVNYCSLEGDTWTETLSRSAERGHGQPGSWRGGDSAEQVQNNSTKSSFDLVPRSYFTQHREQQQPQGSRSITKSVWSSARSG